MDALGMIETHGLVALTASIEAMCKAADVDCVLIERISGGLLVAAVRGDLGSVEQAVEAGRVAAQRYGEVRSSQVYPHPDAALTELVASSGSRLRAVLEAADRGG
jgi:ethanolamine utilization protein EutM